MYALSMLYNFASKLLVVTTTLAVTNFAIILCKRKSLNGFKLTKTNVYVAQRDNYKQCPYSKT